MTEITQADCDVAETLFNDVLGNVSSYGEWGYMSYRQAAERSMAEAFARHREQAAAEERAKIVAWLREEVVVEVLADCIEALEADKREMQLMLQEWREFKRAFLDGLFGRPLQQERSDAQ